MIRLSMRWSVHCLTLAALLFLAACSSTPTSTTNRPTTTAAVDVAPPHRPRLDEVPDAVPRAEEPSRGGNKSPYTVLGKTYQVMPSAEGYRARGIASWYGAKFHGRLTSNGEVYDAYAMTAAHKALPLPTYLRVRNVSNDRSIIVRVNDRGPFHEDRLIDLSYAAAYKLGFHDKGTAIVELEAITGDASGASDVAAQNGSPIATGQSQSLGSAPGAVLQAGAFRSLAGAENLQAALTFLLEEVVFIDQTQTGGAPWYRVRIGPVSKPGSIAKLKRQVAEASLGVLHVVNDGS